MDCSFQLLAPTSSLSVFSSASSTASGRSASSLSPTPDHSLPNTTDSPSSKHYIQSHAYGDTSPYATSSSDEVIEIEPANEVELIGFDSRTSNCALVTSYPYSTVAPFLAFDDSWHDARALLPSSLREVLLHYEYTTSLTLAANDPAKSAWQSYVPEMAARHPWLLNCVLSVAALHLGRLLEFDAQKKRMNGIAASRMNKALMEYRPELQQISYDNAPALFASVTLTAIYLFRMSTLDIESLRASISPGSPAAPPDIAEKMLSSVVRTIHGLRGPMAVLLSGWDWVTGGKMNPVAARKWWPEDRSPATPRAILEDERLESLSNLWEGTENQQRKGNLDHALYILRDTFGLVSQLSLPAGYQPMTAIPYSIDDENVGTLIDRGTVFVWAARITREYLQLLDDKDRDALVILAYYAVLAGRVRNVWWMESMGADIVYAIAMYFNDEDRKLIEWPARVLGIEWSNGVCKRKDRMQGQLGDLEMQVI